MNPVTVAGVPCDRPAAAEHFIVGMSNNDQDRFIH
jgi:hypothetical protein